MTTLTDASRVARALAQAGDCEGAADRLQKATPLLLVEPDSGALLAFAQCCHDWAEPRVEELAWRAVLQREVSLVATEGLLELLHERLNTAEGSARLSIVSECERLATQAIQLLPEASGLDWATLIHARGLHRLELAEGARTRTDLGPLATADLQAYREWLEIGEGLPSHVQKTVLVALADIDLGRTMMLADDQRQQGVELLEGAIAVLEQVGGLNSRVELAYSLLVRLEGER